MKSIELMLRSRWVRYAPVWILQMTIMLFCMAIFTKGERKLTYADLAGASLMLLMHLLFNYVLELFYSRQQYVRAIVAIFSVIILSSVFYQNISLYNSQVKGLLIGLFFCFSLAWQALRRCLSANEKQLRMQSAKNAELESELNLLRAQLRPHFFFNTLQNIYATNLFDSRKANDMVLALADLMRYHIDFTSLSDIRLEKELNIVRQYIELEKSRLKPTDNLIVNINVPETKNRIPPLILLTPVENCFTHGVGINPCTIEIDLVVAEGKLHLTTRNTIQKTHPQTRIKKEGGSLANTIKKLELSFPKKHTLSVRTFDTDFVLSLQLSFV